jgi:allantoicase
MDFRNLPDLAVRTLGGSVVYANDELFAERENLVRPERAVFDTSTFGHKGKVFDGWETRRRREPGHDVAIVRLGAPGVVRGVVVDTAWFTGNFPPEASVEATCVSGYPSADELLSDAEWETLVPRSALDGNCENEFAVDSEGRWTHVRLSIYPDGGVARLRVHGEVVPDPRVLDAGGADLAALENGGRVVGCSDMFYGSPSNLISPGLTRTMGEGWETARRRDDGNDWVELQLAAQGTVALAELDTSYFVGNAPGWAALSGCDASAAGNTSPWHELLPRTRLQPDTRHRFLLAGTPAVRRVRLDIYPDGGMARLRLLGSLSAAGREKLGLRWFNSLSEATATQALMGSGLSEPDVRRLVAARPLAGAAGVPAAARALLVGA